MLREHVTPHDLPVEQQDSISLKVWGERLLKKALQTYLKKLFAQTFLGQLMGGCCSTWRINDRIMPRVREYSKYTFQ